MAQEVGKTTVVVLLILTILVSVVGTWSVLSGLDNARNDLVDISGAKAGGEVSLMIHPEQAPLEVEPQTVESRVSLDIV